MEFDGEPTASTYTNRRPVHPGRMTWEVAGPHAGASRALDRMLIALRAYEQRAQRRGVLRAWLIARNAQGQPPGVTSPVS